MKYYLIYISCLLFLFLFAALIFSNLTPYGSATTPDSLSYLDLAYNIKDGKGFVTTDFSIEKAGHDAVLIQRAWPPLYPKLLSLFISSNNDVKTTSKISFVLYLISACLLFLIFNQYYKTLYSLILASAIIITIPFITVFTYIWSETLFITCLIFLFYIIKIYLSTPFEKEIEKSFFLSCITLILIALMLTRYIGIAYSIILPALFLYSKSCKKHQMLIIFFTGIYLSAITLFLFQNYSLTGSISGFQRPESDKTLSEVILDIFSAIQILLPQSFITYCLVIPFIVIFIYAQKKLYSGKQADGFPDLKYLYILLASLVSYVISLITLRSFKTFDTLDIRLIAPGYLTLILLMLILPACFSPVRRTKHIINGLILAGLLLFSSAGYLHWQKTGENWLLFSTPNHQLSKNILYNNLTIRDNLNLQKKIFTQKTSGQGYVVVTRPLVCRFITKLKCLKKPDDLTMENLAKLNKLPKDSMLVLNELEMNLLTANKYLSDFRFNVEKYGNLFLIDIPFGISKN